MFPSQLQRFGLPRLRYLNYQLRRNYHFYATTAGLLKALRIKPAKVGKSALIELLKPIKLFTSTSSTDALTALNNLNGGLLAAITNEAYTEDNLWELAKLVSTMRAQYLLQADRSAGLTNLLLTTDDEIGHIYLSLSTQAVDQSVYNRLLLSTQLAPLKLASTVFLGFPGSFDTTDLPTMNPDNFPLKVAMDPPLTREDRQSMIARSYIPKPLTEREYQLDQGNYVIIGSAASAIKNGKLGVLSWLNSTTVSHAFDGRVSFSLVPDASENLLHLLAFGYGQHPYSTGDWMNTTLGGAVFDTVLKTFVEALEYHGKTVRAGTDRFTDDDLTKVGKSLVDWTFPISSGLAFKHFTFEAMNAVGGPALQWSRLIGMPNTSTPPASPPKITQVPDDTPAGDVPTSSIKSSESTESSKEK